MFHDLNVPWTENSRELQRTIAFLDELGYDVVALTHTISGKLPADLSSPISIPLSFPTPQRLKILRRCNVFLTDAAANHRLPELRKHYDIIAARPRDERTLQQACGNLDVDIVSLDLTQRFEAYFKYKTLSSALQRGIKIELCYSQAISSSDTTAKRNVISNAVQLIRVTRGGRGLLLSSEAKNVLGVRAPSDIINLASVWGLGQERGKDGLTKEARSVVEFARLKSTSYRGVVDIVYGGEKPAPITAAQRVSNQKRKSESIGSTPVQSGEEQPISKREQKRRGKKTKLEAGQTGATGS